MIRRSGWRWPLFGVALLGTSSHAADVPLRFKLAPRELVEARLGQYGGKNSEREATLKKMFTDAGCGEQVSEQAVSFRPPNVICRLPGKTGRVIIVGAHFDRVKTSEGVADNWSGASLLPSIYEAIKVEPREHTYIFIGFTDEEEGLIGSNFYSRRMTKAQVATTDAMVNMDTIGLATTYVWLSRSNKQLAGALSYVADLIEVPLTGVNFEQVGSTDSESFARKIPSITVHSINQANFDANILHTRKDKFSVVNLDEHYQSYRLMSVYLVFLDLYLDEGWAQSQKGRKGARVR